MLAVGAYAQGKIAFVNDSLHLIYFSDAGHLRGADAALAGQGATATTPSGITLVVDLFGGTSAASLTLQKTTTFSAVPGKWTLANVLSTIPGGAQGFFQVQVRDQAFATATEAMNGNSYAGFSAIFNTTTGASLAYNSIVNHNAPASSTWGDGGFNMDQYGPGSRGVMSVGIVPEPTSMALAGLGAAALMIFRRRK